MSISIHTPGIGRTAADKRYKRLKYNDCGRPGQPGFPNGICREEDLPTGMTPLAGYENETGPNYGNYIFRDGSVMVYRPISFVKIGNGTNGLPVNVIDVKPWGDYASEAAANADGYFVPDIFKNNGFLKMGIFRDKYHCSINALGAGLVASSIKNGNPISTAEDHNPIAGLTACTVNQYYEAITAAKARDGEDGLVNPASIFFVEPRAFSAYMWMASIAHGQASKSSVFCAWYDSAGVTNFPKGCNNNALGDTNDASVLYISDGYSNCGKAGSARPFAKTTDNGQECGIADVNGLMWRINIGVTCVAVTKNIQAVSLANPCVIQCNAHGVTVDGTAVMILSVGGTTQINDKIFTVNVVDANNLSLVGINSSAYGAYTSGGILTYGSFYKKKKSVRYQDFTAGASLATDHWGSTGVAAMMETFIPAFVAGGGFGQRMGNGANQVLSPDISGNNSALTQAGFPMAGGASSGGTNLFGLDYFYQYIINNLCVRSGGSWSSSSDAGTGNVALNHSRANSINYVGFACACYSDDSEAIASV